MENNNKNEMPTQKGDKGILWAIIFTIVAFVGMAVASHFYN